MNAPWFHWFLLGCVAGFAVRPLLELLGALRARFARNPARWRGRDRVVPEMLAELEQRAGAADAARARSPRCECGHFLIDHWFASSSGWLRGDVFTETPATLSLTDSAELNGDVFCAGADQGCECGFFRLPGSARAAAAAVVQENRCAAVSHGALTPHGARCTLRTGHLGGHTFGGLFPRQCDARRRQQRCRLLQQHEGEHAYDDDD